MWGSTWLVLKIGLESAPPFWSATFRFAISFVVLAIVILFRRPDYRPVRKNFGKILFAGFLSYGVNYALIYWGQGYVSSGTASVLFASIPFFTAAFSFMMLPEEKLSGLKILGITIGFVGIVIIYIGDISLKGEMAIWGGAVVTVSSAVAGFVSVFIKRHLKHVDSLLLTHTQMIPGIILLLIMALLFDDFDLLRFDSTTILTTAYLATFGTAFAFWAYFYLLARIEVVKLSLIGFLTPIIALFLGWIVLDETLSARFTAGTFLVLIGIWFASREKKLK